MIIYEVCLNIDSVIFTEYSEWLVDHVKKVIAFKGFKKARILDEIHLDKDSNMKNATHQLIVQYEIDTIENLQEYFSLHATAMRKEGNDLFGKKVKPSRKIYHELTL
ncbi:MAG: DUF4286 family protein [Gammaproteobacteria bacterium]|nr:DUF4286 family protein [Gammaproteobacteria bacterium]